MKRADEERINFINFGYFGLRYPLWYSKQIGNFKNFKIAFLYAFSYIGLGLLSLIIYKIVFFYSWQLFFPAVSESLILLLGIMGLLMAYALLMFTLARIFGGKAGVKKYVIAACYSSFPLSFAFLPVIQFAGFGLFIFYLILSINFIEVFSKIKTLVIVLIPVLIGILFLFALGLIKIKL